jgi:hypothetical protein
VWKWGWQELNEKCCQAVDQDDQILAYSDQTRPDFT